MITAIKKVSTKLSTVSLLTLLWADTAYAQVFGGTPDIGGGGDIRGVVTDVLTEVLGFMALVAVVVIVIAGIRLVVGGADEQQREKARNTVLYAIVGLILILLAQAIVQFVADLA